MTTPDPPTAKEALDYAWKMFEYQASQRMQAFNFFLVLMGGLFVGYTGASKDGEHGLAIVIAAFAAFVAVAFFVLDLRNTELVQTAKDALKEIEKDVALPEGWRLFDVDAQEGFKWNGHRVWLRLIHILLFLGFVFALGQSVCKCKAASARHHRREATQMPYIKQERRDAILNGARPQDAGELNFAITALVDRYLEDKGDIRYAHVNEVVGALDCAKLELYRRVAVPYEDKKIAEAGDVYQILKRKA